ncbi:MAG: hypothetical protein H0T62_05230 [Parachlamydiaceae bacterium]|nr:hypothetical protein [Parachlamydiaceae bacterium]
MNLCWIMHEFATQNVENERVNPFKELENRFWQQELELGSVNELEEPCILHPLIEELLSDSNIRSELYSKKYPFSNDSLNVAALCTGIFTGKISHVSIPLHILTMLLEHHSALGDENTQEKLYSFLAHPLGKINLVDIKKAWK